MENAPAPWGTLTCCVSSSRASNLLYFANQPTQIDTSTDDRGPARLVVSPRSACPRNGNDVSSPMKGDSGGEGSSLTSPPGYHPWQASSQPSVSLLHPDTALSMQ